LRADGDYAMKTDTTKAAGDVADEKPSDQIIDLAA
jgi:hypothetical protein